MFAKEESGKEYVLEPGTRVEAGSGIFLRNIDVQREFSLGDQIALQPKEVYQCVSTLHGFAWTLVKSLGAYGRTQGIVYKDPVSEQIQEESNPNQ